MINCSICAFEVSNKMRHALTKNMCPACGSALFGDFHMQRLNMIRDKISAQDFSLKMDKALIFDISLFIMSEFFNSSPNRAASAGLVKEFAEEAEIESGDIENLDKNDLLSIRDQVRREVSDMSETLDDLPSDSENYNEDILLTPKSEQDLKVAKLKRIYNESTIARKSGTSVRRIT